MDKIKIPSLEVPTNRYIKGHEQADAEAFARWGADSLKYTLFAEACLQNKG